MLIYLILASGNEQWWAKGKVTKVTEEAKTTLGKSFADGGEEKIPIDSAIKSLDQKPTSMTPALVGKTKYGSVQIT